MRRLFRSFEGAGLEYLLISGQASILYGAATFSEDIDIWIRPTPANAARLLRALASCGATVYKLTPRLTRRNLALGHGFHFLVPDRAAPVYLDVMGRPPRVGAFGAARRRAGLMSTEWGRVPVVAIGDLIALKLTKRLSDYEVISNLVRIRVSEGAPAGRALLRWAATSTFRAEDRVEFARRLGESVSEEECRGAILAEIAAHQARDAAYWRTIIEDLRVLRAQGRLLPLGRPVGELLGRSE